MAEQQKPKQGKIRRTVPPTLLPKMVEVINAQKAQLSFILEGFKARRQHIVAGELLAGETLSEQQLTTLIETTEQGIAELEAMLPYFK